VIHKLNSEIREYSRPQSRAIKLKPPFLQNRMSRAAKGSQLRFP